MGQENCKEEAHHLCPRSFAGSQGNHGMHTVRGFPLMQILNHSQAQSACDFIALSLLASAVLTWGSIVKRKETFSWNGPSEHQRCLPTPIAQGTLQPKQPYPERCSGPETTQSFLNESLPPVPFNLHQHLLFDVTLLLFPFPLPPAHVHPSICHASGSRANRE